jgi:hypothetical protein
MGYDKRKLQRGAEMRIERWAACAAIALAALSAKGHAQNGALLLPDITKGDHLYHACRASVRNMNMDASDYSQIPSAALQADTECVVYVSGFLDGYTANMGPSSNLFCLDKTASVGVIVRLYVQYMAAHPKLLDVDKVIGLSDALQANYPCSTKQQ